MLVFFNEVFKIRRDESKKTFANKEDNFKINSLASIGSQ